MTGIEYLTCGIWLLGTINFYAKNAGWIFAFLLYSIFWTQFFHLESTPKASIALPRLPAEGAVGQAGANVEVLRIGMVEDDRRGGLLRYQLIG